MSPLRPFVADVIIGSRRSIVLVRKSRAAHGAYSRSKRASLLPLSPTAYSASTLRARLGLRFTRRIVKNVVSVAPEDGKKKEDAGRGPFLLTTDGRTSPFACVLITTKFLPVFLGHIRVDLDVAGASPMPILAILLRARNPIFLARLDVEVGQLDHGAPGARISSKTVLAPRQIPRHFEYVNCLPHPNYYHCHHDRHARYKNRPNAATATY